TLPHEVFTRKGTLFQVALPAARDEIRKGVLSPLRQRNVVIDGLVSRSEHCLAVLASRIREQAPDCRGRDRTVARRSDLLLPPFVRIFALIPAVAPHPHPSRSARPPLRFLAGQESIKA